MTAAPFYKNLVALDRRQHARLKLAPGGRLAFAADTPVVPVVLGEFEALARQCPIAFLPADGGAPVAVAVLGLPDGRNLWLDRRGQWTGNDQVPVFLRSYPFALAERRAGESVLCIDRGFKGVSEKAGQPLFDADGQPTALVTEALELLTRFEQQRGATRAFAARLAAAGLLVPAEAEARLADGRAASLQGLMVVDEARLRALPPASLQALMHSGELDAVYAHRLSLGHLLELVRRQPAAATAATTASAAA